LEDKFRDFGKELVLLRMKKKQRALKDISQIDKVKKNIARVSTYLTAQKKKARSIAPAAASGGKNA